MEPLPPLFQQFVEQQTTVAVEEISAPPTEPVQSRYGDPWTRAVAAILLSGRIRSTHSGPPNKTDIERVCKEANLNQYLFGSIGAFLVDADVLKRDYRTELYVPGPQHTVFWAYELAGLQTITRAVFCKLIERTKNRVRQSVSVQDSRFVELLTLFFRCFEGRALPLKQFVTILDDFAELPPEHLRNLAQRSALKTRASGRPFSLEWLNRTGEKIIVDSLFEMYWAYVDDSDAPQWIFPSEMGLAMLGLGPLPTAPPLLTDLKVQADLSVFAGAGLPFEQLTPLFRHCVIKRVGPLFEFQLDRRRLAAEQAMKEVNSVLAKVTPLPPTVADLLQAPTRFTGVLKLRGCSALVKPPSEEALAAIRKHPNLKGYLEPGAPPGYLLLKPRASFQSFVHRCRELGFEVESL